MNKLLQTVLSFFNSKDDDDDKLDSSIYPIGYNSKDDNDDNDDIDDNDNNVDNDEYIDDDDCDIHISIKEANRFMKIYERFYNRLSDEETEDHDLNEALEQVQENYYAGKIGDPELALSYAYQQWKENAPERTLRKKNRRQIALQMIRDYDHLTEEEKGELEQELCESLEESDGLEIAKIFDKWVTDKTLTEEKISLIETLESSNDPNLRFRLNGDSLISYRYYKFFPTNETAIDHAEFKQRMAIFNSSPIEQMAMEPFLKYTIRYYFENQDTLTPIEEDEGSLRPLSEPVFFRKEMGFWTPFWHYGKREFGNTDESYQRIKFIIFSNRIEYLAQKGPVKIHFNDVIDLKFDEIDAYKNWYNHKKDCDENRYLGSYLMLEIVTSNQSIYLSEDLRLSSFGVTKEPAKRSDLLICRAIITYFIKKQLRQ